MQIRLPKPLPWMVLVGTFLIITSCGDSLDPFEPELTNAADNFQLQATNVTSTSVTRTYTWLNTGTRATINHSTTTTAGQAQVTIRDASGATVYDRALAASLNESTTVGTTGAWTIQLRLTNYSGTLNFRVQRL
ncbi:MAG TPA: hypothetical protein VGD27_01905 [Longimicrobiales bacterium]